MSEDQRPAGSWLGGVRSAGVDLGYPGGRLDLPREGSGSVAGYGRRLLALFVDWVLSLLVVALVGAAAGWGQGTRSLVTLAVFGVATWVLTALMGATAGKRLCGVRVARLDRRPVGIGWALARTALLILVVPALLWDRNYRGLHDRVAGTVVVRS